MDKAPLAPDPLGATSAASTPATAATSPAHASSCRSPPPTLSPSPCPFLWADCAEDDEVEVSAVPVMRESDSADLSGLRGSGAVGGATAVPLGA